jgi:hypothetical protein
MGDSGKWKGQLIGNADYLDGTPGNEFVAEQEKLCISVLRNWPSKWQGKVSGGT